MLKGTLAPQTLRGAWIGLIAILLGLAQPAVAQQPVAVVEKVHTYLQQDDTTVTDTISTLPWFFLVNIDPSATGAVGFTPPGGTFQALTLGTGAAAYSYQQKFANQAGTDAAYPDGTYQLSLNGHTVPANLTGDAYPNAPVATLGYDPNDPLDGNTWAWDNGVLVFDPTKLFNITLDFTQNYVSGQSRMAITITPTTGANLQAASGTDFTKEQLILNVPANTFTAGTTGTVSLNLGNYVAMDTASVPGFTVGAVYGAQTTFRFQAGNTVVAAFSQQPQSQTVDQGTDVTFTAAVTGGIVLNYQWMHDGNPVGAASATLTLTNVQPAASGNYWAVALLAGGGQLVSNTAVLTVIAIPPPVFTLQPQSQTVAAGSTATFTAVVTGATSYQWRLNGNTVPNGTGPTLTIPNVSQISAGTYTLTAFNSTGQTASNFVTLTVTSAPAGPLPVITVEPFGQTANLGATVTFIAAATGATSYQWRLNGNTLPNGTSATLTVTNVGTISAGSYTLTATNSAGSATSSPALLTVNTVPASPSITLQPVAQTVAAGSTAVFSVAASGNPVPHYLWSFNGTPIPTATDSFYLVSGATSANAGAYTCVVSNSAGQATTAGAGLTVTNTTSPGRLINLSLLSYIQGSLSMGFVLGPNGFTGSDSLLIRGVGPSIGPGTLFNVGGVMPDPTLSVVQQIPSQTIIKNAGWAGQAAVTAADTATGAFALSNAASLDSAVVVNLPVVGGGYSATVTGAAQDNGYALTEVYDASNSTSATTPRLVNLSCLTQIPAGGTIDVGFVIGGTSNKTLLIRASGPALAALYGLSGTMPDPQVAVSPSNNSAAILAANAGWGGDAVVASAASSIGAFAFPSLTSQDSATLVTLAPGIPYAVQVKSTSGSAGTVLVEIYEVP